MMNSGCGETGSRSRYLPLDQLLRSSPGTEGSSPSNLTTAEISMTEEPMPFTAAWLELYAKLRKAKPGGSRVCAQTFTKNKKARLLQYQNNTCCWCGHYLSFEQATWEHIIPKSLGGADHENNMALSHKPCNEARSSDVTQEPHRSHLFDFVRAVLRTNGAYRAVHFTPGEYKGMTMEEFWRQQE